MDNIKKIAQFLDKNGYYSEANFISLEESSSIAKEVKDLFSKINFKATKEYDDYIVANHLPESGSKISGAPGQKHKPVILIRGEDEFDLGFVEIFQADKLISNIPVDKISKFIKDLMGKMNINNINLKYSIYSNMNGSVKKVRGYHRDIPLAGSKFLKKFFIYLTDVPDISYGPYSFIEGSHKPSECIRFANHLVGNYDDPNEYDCALSPKIFLGKAGTMVITTQDGLHRGLQQDIGKDRMVLVCKIRLK